MKNFFILLAAVSLSAVSCQNSQTDLSQPVKKELLNPKTMLTLISPAFINNGSIPQKYTCQSQPPAGKINPPLIFENVPKNTKSLAIIMDDPDVPKNLIPSGVFDHWVVFNMSPSTKSISEPGDSEPLGLMGKNGRGETAYTGPCPPNGEHRYFFRLYALDVVLPLKEGATKLEVLNAMQGHIIEQAELVGKYAKN
jgi:Raf kinase inhibitor-like YbhB/YbcL family protein